ncbi:hypothetical protein N0M98_19770 [Paenibacillus doosanensis]|uniref:Uncharacterized protein n=1 Tax=Paenibacillus konkukensis TaxID=2020716 RepID=A0ABY4RM86_9BACL|nr:MULTISPECIES: hypothetical protein [Paenibacillus]MCS7462362.1 hypothetical protein [Paenibacillus doosanensis]UQZ83258.1 hypothetical protein SK3146_02419 [Paenibacillus konkukensis]
MQYSIYQSVKLVDMNDEIMSEVLFDHGQHELVALSVGSSVITHQLGLRQFEVVYDKREGKQQRVKIVDIETDLMQVPAATRVYLEPVTLIIGQHDVGEIY